MKRKFCTQCGKSPKGEMHRILRGNVMQIEKDGYLSGIKYVAVCMDCYMELAPHKYKICHNFCEECKMPWCNICMPYYDDRCTCPNGGGF